MRVFRLPEALLLDKLLIFLIIQHRERFNLAFCAILRILRHLLRGALRAFANGIGKTLLAHRFFHFYFAAPELAIAVVHFRRSLHPILKLGIVQIVPIGKVLEIVYKAAGFLIILLIYSVLCLIVKVSYLELSA